MQRLLRDALVHAGMVRQHADAPVLLVVGGEMLEHGEDLFTL